VLQVIFNRVGDVPDWVLYLSSRGYREALQGA